MTFTPGIKQAELGMQFHGGRTSPQFQLFFWRGRLRSAIVRAMTVTFANPNSKYLTHTFKAGRFAGTRISYLIGGSTANVWTTTSGRRREDVRAERRREEERQDHQHVVEDRRDRVVPRSLTARRHQSCPARWHTARACPLSSVGRAPPW